MERICSFNEYVLLQEGSRLTSSKTGLYPLGYGGIGLYPDADYLTHAADAIFISHRTRGFTTTKTKHLSTSPTCPDTSCLVIKSIVVMAIRSTSMIYQVSQILRRTARCQARSFRSRVGSNWSSTQKQSRPHRRPDCQNRKGSDMKPINEYIVSHPDGWAMH